VEKKTKIGKYNVLYQRAIILTNVPYNAVKGGEIRETAGVGK